MNYSTITFYFNEDDFNTYEVKINGNSYSINCDNPSIKTKVDENCNISISHKDSPLNLGNTLLLFLLEFVKLLFFVFFYITPNSKWYFGTHIYNFNYIYEILDGNMENYRFKIDNDFLHTEINCSKRPKIIPLENLDVQTIKENVFVCYYNLKRHLFKHVSKLIWLYLILFSLILLFFSEFVAILAVLSVILTILVATLIFLSIKKYKAILKATKDDSLC